MNASHGRDYFAHTRNRDGTRHRLEDHLRQVAMQSAAFAADFGTAGIARLAGILHDVGKFNPAFQHYLLECEKTQGKPPPGSVPHSLHGALWAAELGQQVLPFVLAGHHGGLADRSELRARLSNPPSQWSNVQELARDAAGDLFAGLAEAVPLPEWTGNPLPCEFLIRMLFSALVDADWLDTEQHFDSARTERRGGAPALAELWIRFQSDQEALQSGLKEPDSSVNRARHEIYQACLDAADGPPGVYRLTVPTGGGKTRSGMAFALRHALKHGLGRVIVAIPYTSIIDQTADVYRRIFGDENVLEHHSAIELPDDPSEAQSEAELRRRLAAENWDAPIVVTTTVQLFDSLFSNRRTRCRKLHNLARSVIILDEVQTLPTHLLSPIIEVLKELVAHYGVTLVLSTATQPAFSGESPYLKGFNPEPREIVPDPSRYLESLKRVEYQVAEQPWPWERVAEEMSRHRQALCVVNSRRDALALFHLLEDPEALHLSTLMCPAHRRAALTEIRRRLDNDLPCRVVSTQVVEAGVDLDFPAVFRAMGPLDRIVQAAGRCNREGKLPGPGKAVVFEPTDGHGPPGTYATAMAEAGRSLKEKGCDLNDPGVFTRYFRRLWQNCDLDRKRIMESRKRFNYQDVADRFRMIDEDTVGVVVSYGEPGPGPALARIRYEKKLSRRDWRELQSYTVSLFRKQLTRYRKEGLVEPVMDELCLWTGTYHPSTGISEDAADPSDLIA